jgi:hypothetical protein
MQVYPALRRVGIKFTPLKKMTAGFFLSAAAVAWAAVVQHYIYKVGANVAHFIKMDPYSRRRALVAVSPRHVAMLLGNDSHPLSMSGSKAARESIILSFRSFLS